MRSPLAALAALAAVIASDSATSAAGLNTNVALSPPEGGTIVRAQWRYTRLNDDPTAFGREVDLSLTPVTVVHGVTSDFTVLATVPLADREIDVGRTGAQHDDRGVADIPLVAKYRFFQKDEPGVTTRWAAIGGAELPTFDEPLSSESVDPIIGTVWTHQRRDWWVDWDLIYQVNTSGGLVGDDRLRADVAYSHRLFGGRGESIGPWGVYGIAELNGTYRTDGSTELLGSPGLQLITPNWIFEAGVQLPIVQDPAVPRLEREWTTVLSVRVQF